MRVENVKILRGIGYNLQTKELKASDEKDKKLISTNLRDFKYFEQSYPRGGYN